MTQIRIIYLKDIRKNVMKTTLQLIHYKITEINMLLLLAMKKDLRLLQEKRVSCKNR